jgi:hypothetical protein
VKNNPTNPIRGNHNNPTYIEGIKVQDNRKLPNQIINFGVQLSFRRYAKRIS